MAGKCEASLFAYQPRGNGAAVFVAPGEKNRDSNGHKRQRTNNNAQNCIT